MPGTGRALDQGYFQCMTKAPSTFRLGHLFRYFRPLATPHDFVSKQASSADAAQTALPQKAGTGAHGTSHVHGASAGMPAVSAGQAASST